MSLRSKVIRLAHAYPEFRTQLLSTLKTGCEGGTCTCGGTCGCGGGESTVKGKFEEGVPADPTEGMSPEDKKKWEEANKEHGDKFKTAGEGRLVDAIRSGDRVTIVDRFGKQQSGRAVMRSSHGGWVLNMGGAHGTPGLASDDNIVKVSPGKGKPSYLASSKTAGSVNDPVKLTIEKAATGGFEITGDGKNFRTFKAPDLAALPETLREALRTTVTWRFLDWEGPGVTVTMDPIPASVMSTLVPLLAGEKAKVNMVYDMQKDNYTVNGKKASTSKQAARSLFDIAAEIRGDWRPVNYAAKPYLDAMAQMDKITDDYGQDDGKSIVMYFLSNARAWKGDTAKRIKAELQAMTKGKSAAAALRLKDQLRTKTGKVVPAGTEAVIEWVESRPSLVNVKVAGQANPIKVSTINLHYYFSDFEIPPTRAAAAKMFEKEEATTPTGQKCAVDGYAKDGSPSWLLVLDMV